MFDEIVTNPAEWTASGLLELRRRVDPSGPQHACTVGCSPNMCKGPSVSVGVSRGSRLFRVILFLGDELEAFFARHVPAYDRVVYVGDGSNDFCPALRMRRCVASRLAA
jgi:pyridoxal phosphate phosphatase PHOSPHO2